MALLDLCLGSQHSWLHIRTISWSPSKTLHIKCHGSKTIWLWKMMVCQQERIHKIPFWGIVLGEKTATYFGNRSLVFFWKGIPQSLTHLLFVEQKKPLDYYIRFSGFGEWIFLFSPLQPVRTCNNFKVISSKGHTCHYCRSPIFTVRFWCHWPVDMEGSVRDHSELVKGAWLEKKNKHISNKQKSSC